MLPFTKNTLLCFSALLPLLASSCSDFLLKSTIPTDVISARTMDHVADLVNVLEVIPRGTRFNEPIVRNCSACPQYSWRSKFGFVGINAFGLNAAVDGMNERGLSAAYLGLAATDYPPLNVPSMNQQHQQQNPSLPIVTSICTYLLGNYATIDELKKGIRHIQFAEIGDLSKIFPGVPPMRFPYHISVHDAVGKNLVIEFIHGEVKVYDNVNTVLTNDPPLEEQLALLKALNGSIANLPGGYDPIPRFQRASVLNDVADQWTRNLTASEMDKLSFLKGTDEQRSIANAMHVINAVVQPFQSLTHWSLVRDHARAKLYVQAAQNQVPRRINLEELEFGNPRSRHVIPMTQGDWFVDITKPLQDPSNTVKSIDFPVIARN